MKTQTTAIKAQLILKDGHTSLASWAQEFETRPVIGETVELPGSLALDPGVYSPRAVVSRIEVQDGAPDRIELAATCLVPRRDRPVVALNASRIRPELRETAEAQVRRLLGHPVIDWETSYDADPVVRFHQPGPPGSTSPAGVRSSLLELLSQPDTRTQN